MLLLVAVCGILAVSSGCQSTGKKLSAANPLKSWNDEEPEIEAPDRIVSTWTEAVLHQEGQSTRGFGGRLFFYSRKSDKPVRVAGQLVVYAFAEDGREATDNCPTKRYVFPPDQFAKHESKGEEASEIGTSYSVWLPWDVVGGPQSDVSLIARFEPLRGGGLVVSEQARQRLPGPPRPATMLAEEQKASKIKRTAFHETASNTATTADFQQPLPATQPGVTATTIPLPGRYAAPSSIGLGTTTPGGTTTSANPALPSSQTTTVPSITRPSTTIPARAGAIPPGMPPPGTAIPGMSAQGMSPVIEGGELPAQTGPHQPTPIGTSVKMLTPGESVRQSLQPRSFGSLQ